jgi:hypothetical protein
MATLEELQDQLAALKERYSEVIEGSYSYEESIATIAVNMQAQLEDAQAAATSAGVYAAAAESAADEAADAGATAGTAAGAEAGATAGTAAAQAVYDTVFTQEHTYTDTQNFSDITIQGAGPIVKEQAAWLMQNAVSAYKADSYFTNLWASKQTDDIYVRRINKFDYNPAPAMAEAWDSVPRTVNLALKDGGTRNYENALYTLFVTADKDAKPYCTPATDVTLGYDPVKDVLVGFWDRCNYYKDSNGDVRITAVRGDDDFDKRKADVGTFGPTLWFDIRDSLEKDSDGNVMYTDIIVSTAPHPELGLHPHPLALRSDGTVAPYWCCSAYPAGTKNYQLVSAYGSNILLKKKNLDASYTGSYSEYLTASEAAEYCRNRGKGYGGGVYINFLVQLMFLLKYGTKDSQSVFAGVTQDNVSRASMIFNVNNNITKADISYDLARGAHWIPIVDNAQLYSVFFGGHAINIGITGENADNRGLPDNDTPLPVLNIEPAEAAGTRYYKIFLETEYSIRLQPTDTVSIHSSLAPAGITDRVLMNYDGVSGYSAWAALKEGFESSSYTSATSITFANTIFQEPTYPFRIHGIEYGMHGELFMDKIWQTPTGVVLEGSVTTGYYRLPWEEKNLDINTTHTTSETYSAEAYGADYSTLIVKTADDPVNEYDVVIGVPVPNLTGKGSTLLGLCDVYEAPNSGGGAYGAISWGYSGDATGGLFCAECFSMSYSTETVGIRL